MSIEKEVVSLGNQGIEYEVVSLLKERGLKVMTVESCTGGMVASRLIDVPGASEVLESSFVTYSDLAKEKLAGVRHETLESKTAVSAETAREMVSGLGKWKADVMIGVTGYASSVGDPKLDGLVFISCNVSGRTKVCEFHFKGSRKEVRESACLEALKLAKACILGL